MNFEATDPKGHPPGAAFSIWAAPDGWRLRRMDWPQPGGVAARGSLLFANGRGDFVEKYLEPLAHWHERGWNVASFDWRGQGDSRGDIIGGHLDTFDPLVDDLAAMVEEWRASTPAPHVLIGHSMGGHLALRLLAERKAEVDASVLIAPMIGINASPVPHWLGSRIAKISCALGLRRRRAWETNERPTLPGLGRQRFLTSCPRRYANELWWKAKQPGFSLGPPSWGWLDAAFTSIEAVTPEKLAGIEVPVLIVGTDRDRLVSPTAIYRAAKLIPKLELMMFPKAGHEVLRESDPVRLAALRRIDEFLDRNAKA